MIDSKFDTLKNKIVERRALNYEVIKGTANMTLEENREIESKVATLDVEITSLLEEYILEPIVITKD